MRVLASFLLAVFFGLGSMIGSAYASSDAVWNPAEQLLTVHGVQIASSSDSNTYYAVMQLAGSSDGSPIFAINEIGLDTASSGAYYYPSRMELKFDIDIDGKNYSVLMQLVQEGDVAYFRLLDIHAYTVY